MPKRKLVSAQEVLSLESIPGADRIEVATINGWKTVVPKHQFSVGDIGFFYEIDAIPPDLDIYKFLWTNKNNPDGIRPAKYRIKTMRLRKQLSQGLLLPVNDVLNQHGIDSDQFDIVVGEDYTDLLGVEKYEAPIPIEQGFDGDWQFAAPKTDEQRIQSLPAMIDELTGKPYVISVKYDGTSMSVGYTADAEFKICGRNYSIAPGDNAFWTAFRDSNVNKFLDNHPRWIVQGELVGPGIQKNPLELKRPEFHVFGVVDQDERKPVPYDLYRDEIDDLSIKHVYVLEEGVDFQYSMQALLEMAAAGYYRNTKNRIEGIVVRPAAETIYSDVLGSWLSFKVINDEMLLEESD